MIGVTTYSNAIYFKIYNHNYTFILVLCFVLSDQLKSIINQFENYRQLNFICSINEQYIYIRFKFIDR